MTIDPETLNRLRRGVPLRLDTVGRWWWGEEPVTHPRIAAALTAGLDCGPDGSPIVRLGHQWCYVTIADTPLRVLAVRRTSGGLAVRLDDGRELPLVYGTLWEEPGAGLRCTVTSMSSGCSLAARFTSASLTDLAPWIEWDEAQDRALLRIGMLRHIIPDEPPR